MKMGTEKWLGEKKETTAVQTENKMKNWCLFDSIFKRHSHSSYHQHHAYHHSHKTHPRPKRQTRKNERRNFSVILLLDNIRKR